MLHLFAAAAVPAVGDERVCGARTADGVVSIGQGSYTTSLRSFDEQDHGPQFDVFVKEGLKAPLPTSDWWTTVLTERFSRNLFAFPLAFRCEETGLLVDRPGLLQKKDTIYSPFDADLCIGLQGHVFERADVADWGDFTVDVSFRGSPSFEATIGHGLPFVYAEFEAGVPEVRALGDAHVVVQHADGLLLRAGRQHYGLYVQGEGVRFDLTSWTAEKKIALPGCRYVAIAALPGSAAFSTWKSAAFQRVTGSRIDAVYDVQRGTVRTTYRLLTEPVRGPAGPAWLALMPHHYKRQGLPLSDDGYDSLRGRLRLLNASNFQTTLPFHGLLPSLPQPAGEQFEASHLQELVSAVAAEQPVFEASKDPEIRQIMERGSDVIVPQDTYFLGKQIAHIARLVSIAEQMGSERAKGRLLDALRDELTDWLTATPGEKDHYFYYDDRCGGLIGMNSSFFTYDYTDHHFHYGHFVYASAILAMHDETFLQDYGPMVELLIHDYASPNRDHPLFTWQRMMDPWEGHSWANGRGGWGDGLEDDGNDQESSSEAMHAWQAIALWGMVTGNRQLRDHGICGYVTEASAVREYYFDVDNDIYPPRRGDDPFQHEFVTLLSGGRASYPGYSSFPEYVFGIQYLPMTSGSLYLGYEPKAVRRQRENFLAENGGVETRWFDNMWMFEALADPSAVLRRYDESATIDRDGNSFATVYHWLHFFDGAGQVDTTVAAPWPWYGCFRRGDRLTVVAYNPRGQVVEIPFRRRDSGQPVLTLRVPGKSLHSQVVTIERD
ncbi:MAG: glycosyl hydrolase [Planctomycetaceae bacterium]|nr:glycosyl hydrolase [Planctomycetaceae bacterium]